MKIKFFEFQFQFCIRPRRLSTKINKFNEPAIESRDIEEDADAFVGQGGDGEADPASEERPTVKGVLPLERNVHLVRRDLALQ